MYHIYHYQNYGPNHRVCQLTMQQSYLNSVLFLNNNFYSCSQEQTLT